MRERSEGSDAEGECGRPQRSAAPVHRSAPAEASGQAGRGGSAGGAGGRRRPFDGDPAAVRAFLAAIVDSSDDAVIGKSLEGEVLSWNPGAERLFGYRASEMIGRPIHRIVPPERREEEAETLRRLADGESLAPYETLRLTRSGRRVVVSLRISPIRDSSGRVVGASSVARDVSDRVRMAEAIERERRTLEAVLETAPLATVVMDQNGRVRLWNRAATELFGWREDEVLGREVPQVPADRRFESLDHLHDTLAGRPLEGAETVRLHKDGTPVEVALWSSALEGAPGRERRVVGVYAETGTRRRIERAARESQERLRAALSASRTGTFRWDVGARRLQWDESLASMLEIPGRRSEAAVGDFLAFVHPEDRDAVGRASGHSARTGDDLEMDFRVVLADGSVRWLYAKGRLVPGEDGTPGAMTGACVDVTERKRAEESLRESEERFRTLADNIAQSAWMADGSGWIFWYNERWFDYTGTRLENVQGWGWRKLVHPAHTERVVASLERAFESGERWEDTFPLRGRDGSWRWFLSRAVPIRDAQGRVHRWLGTNTDITERMQMEEALRQDDRRKDEFLATLGHELRNPLAPIANGLELLRAGADDPALRGRVLETLERQTGHLTRLVDDLLDLSRITRGKVELRRSDVELRALVKSAVESSQALIEEGGHTLELSLPERPLRLRVDPTRIAQVLSNLLNNAARYTPPGGCIRLTAARRGDEAEIVVEDTGAGLEQDMLERVFDMFVRRADGRSGDDRGLGIGLTLARSLVELHGGSIRARSEGPGKGSAFIVRLPVQIAESASPREAAERPGVDEEGEPLRVLVVDDNRDAADSLMLLIRVLGHDTHVVYDGEGALKLAAELRPDLVLLDLGMPGMDGYETAMRLRDSEHGAGLHLAALTGWGQESDRARTRDAGFDHHLVKPTSKRELEALLGEVEAKKRRS